MSCWCAGAPSLPFNELCSLICFLLMVWAGTLPFGSVCTLPCKQTVAVLGGRTMQNSTVCSNSHDGVLSPGEEASGFPKQHIPGLFWAGFAWADLVMYANGPYVHSLGLQYQLKTQGLGRSLTGWIQRKGLNHRGSLGVHWASWEVSLMQATCISKPASKSHNYFTQVVKMQFCTLAFLQKQFSNFL